MSGLVNERSWFCLCFDLENFVELVIGFPFIRLFNIILNFFKKTYVSNVTRHDYLFQPYSNSTHMLYLYIIIYTHLTNSHMYMFSRLTQNVRNRKSLIPHTNTHKYTHVQACTHIHDSNNVKSKAFS